MDLIKVMEMLVNIVETIMAKEIPHEEDPEVNARMIALKERLEMLVMELTDRTEQKS